MEEIGEKVFALNTLNGAPFRDRTFKIIGVVQSEVNSSSSSSGNGNINNSSQSSKNNTKTLQNQIKEVKKNKCLRGSRRNYCNYFVVITFILTVIKNECEMNPHNLRTWYEQVLTVCSRFCFFFA